jgi:hypothetical protein
MAESSQDRSGRWLGHSLARRDAALVDARWPSGAPAVGAIRGTEKRNISRTQSELSLSREGRSAPQMKTKYTA